MAPGGPVSKAEVVTPEMLEVPTALIVTLMFGSVVSSCPIVVSVVEP